MFLSILRQTGLSIAVRIEIIMNNDLFIRISNRLIELDWTCETAAVKIKIRAFGARKREASWDGWVGWRKIRISSRRDQNRCC